MSPSDTVVDRQLTRRGILLHEGPYVVLYLAALALVALTSRAAAAATIYWQILIPFAALVSLLSGWRHAGAAGAGHRAYVVKQLLHWGALLLVIQLLYAHAIQDFLNDQQDAFVMMYLLGLTAILAGISLDRRMAVFGLFLLLSGVAMAALEDNAIMLTLIFLAALLGIGVTLLIRARHHGRRHPTA